MTDVIEILEACNWCIPPVLSELSELKKQGQLDEPFLLIVDDGEALEYTIHEISTGNEVSKVRYSHQRGENDPVEYNVPGVGQAECRACGSDFDLMRTKYETYVDGICVDYNENEDEAADIVAQAMNLGARLLKPKSDMVEQYPVSCLLKTENIFTREVPFRGHKHTPKEKRVTVGDVRVHIQEPDHYHNTMHELWCKTPRTLDARTQEHMLGLYDSNVRVAFVYENCALCDTRMHTQQFSTR